MLFIFAGLSAGYYSDAKTGLRATLKRPYQPAFAEITKKYILPIDDTGACLYAACYFASTPGKLPGVEITLLHVFAEGDIDAFESPVEAARHEIDHFRHGMAAQWVGAERTPKRFNIITDTSDFYRVEYDDVVILDEHPYLIRNNEREGRFGIDDEQKFWVKRAVDLADGSAKILKLTFHERFQSRVGDIVFECVRSPRKEARILDLVKGNKKFMQGFSVSDSQGNNVRIIDYIVGKPLDSLVPDYGKDHEEYFYGHFPSLLDKLTVDDINLVFRNRVANLQKLFPYIPDRLNLVLRHFSQGANLFYDDCGQLLDDLQEFVDNLL